LLGLSVPAALGLAATEQPGNPATQLVASPASKLVLEGSSNVTDWRCSGVTIDANMAVAASLERINAVIDRVEDGNIGVWMAAADSGSFPVPEFAMRIPVDALRCGNRQMERDLGHALHADEHPSIEFRFTGLRGTVSHDIDTHHYTATIGGVLSLAGTSRPISVSVVAQRVSRNRFRLRAELPLRMTDFRITPPTALFGMVKARDELKVRFDLVLEPR
jgi:hypothetical protein